MNEKRLYKDRTNQMLGGVCAGIGNYLGIDPTLVRLAWIALGMIGGSGILAYIIAAIVIPEEPTITQLPDDNQEQ